MELKEKLAPWIENRTYAVCCGIIIGAMFYLLHVVHPMLKPLHLHSSYQVEYYGQKLDLLV